METPAGKSPILPRRRFFLDGIAQDVAGRKMHEPQALAQQLRLRAFAAARRADEDQSHKMLLPGTAADETPARIES